MMERNRWETAIRCLEVALHPNTGDDEVIAGVNGFRRTADGTPLGEILQALAGASAPARADDELVRLSRENLDLRQQAAETERHLRAAEQRLHALEQQHRAAAAQADLAERELAEFHAAYGRVLDRVNRDNAELRQALDRARQGALERPEIAAPFRKFLAAAQQRADRTAPAAHRTSPEGTASAIFVAGPDRAWMA